MNDEPGKLYSTAEAAVYLGLHVQVVKYHIYTAKDLVPDVRLGRNLGFYQATLDAFNAAKRESGRPPTLPPEQRRQRLTKKGHDNER